MKISAFTLFFSALCAFGQPFGVFNGPRSMGSLQIPRTSLQIEHRINEGSGQWVNNRVYDIPNHNQMFSYSEQLFSKSPWGNDGVTLTEGVALNPFGTATTATRVNATTSLKRLYQTTLTFTAQPYTISVYAISASATNQTFRFAHNDSGSTVFSGDNTVTTNWQRFTHTWTATAGTNKIAYITYYDTSTNNYDIYIYGPQLEAGSSATAYETPNYHVQLGKYTMVDSLDPTWTSGTSLDYPANAYGTCLTYLPSTISNFTAYATVKWTRAPVNVHTGIFFTDGNFRLGVQGSTIGTTNNVPDFYFNGNESTVNTVNVNQFPLNQWHTMVSCRQGTSFKTYIDDLLVNDVTIAATNTALVNLFNYGNYQDLLKPWAGEIGELLFYDTAHSKLQVFYTTGALRLRMQEKALSINPVEKFALMEGDSITATVAVTSYCKRAVFLSSPTFSYYNTATSGATPTIVASRAASDDAYLLNNTCSRRKNILSVFITNGPDTDTNYFNNVKTYCQARQAAGWKVIMCTITPSTAVGFNAARNTQNTAIRADPSFYDALSDFAADPTMGPDAAASDTSLYSDGKHPTNLGHSILAPIWRAAFDSL